MEEKKSEILNKFDESRIDTIQENNYICRKLIQIFSLKITQFKSLNFFVTKNISMYIFEKKMTKNFKIWAYFKVKKFSICRKLNFIWKKFSKSLSKKIIHFKNVLEEKKLPMGSNPKSLYGDQKFLSKIQLKKFIFFCWNFELFFIPILRTPNKKSMFWSKLKISVKTKNMGQN